MLRGRTCSTIDRIETRVCVCEWGYLLAHYMNVCKPSMCFFFFFAVHASFMCIIRFLFSIPINVT